MSIQLTSKIVKVLGKVQGVGFRFYTQKEARLLGVSGFVKNMPDGSVYIEAEGEKDNMEAFVFWCRKGPEWARVDEINIQDKPIENYDAFDIR